MKEEATATLLERYRKWKAIGSAIEDPQLNSAHRGALSDYKKLVKKSAGIRIRCTPIERIALELASLEDGLTYSEFLRQLIQQAAKKRGLWMTAKREARGLLLYEEHQIALDTAREA